MKDAFKTVNKRIKLFARQAGILRLAFTDARMTVAADGTIKGADDLSALAGQDALLSYMEEDALTFETLLHTDAEIVIAVAAGEEIYAKKMIDTFLEEHPIPSLMSVIVQPAARTETALADRLLQPFSALRREVAQSLKRL